MVCGVWSVSRRALELSFATKPSCFVARSFVLLRSKSSGNGGGGSASSGGGGERREWRGDQAAEGVPQLPDQAEARRLRRRRRGALVSGNSETSQTNRYLSFEAIANLPQF